MAEHDVGRVVVGPAPNDDRQRARERSMPELVRSIAVDTSTLVRKELELARREVTERVVAKAKGVGLLAVGGVLALFVVAFLGAAMAAALDQVAARWASRLIVAVTFLALAGAAGLVGLRAMKRPPHPPEETKQRLKEDIRWARAQLKR